MTRVWTDDPAVVKEAVEVRMLRQEYLARNIRLHFILDEATVRRVIGDVGLMRDQVDHLLRKAATPQVQLQTLPFSRGAHPGMTSGFAVLQFATVPGLVLLEGLDSDRDLYVDRPEEVNRYLRTFDRLRKVALTAEESIPFLETVRSSYRTDRILTFNEETKD